MPHTDRVIRKLNRLLELDFDAIEAYESAIAGLKDLKNQHALQAYCDDHRRHTQVLSEIVVALGGQPARGSDWMRLLTVGKVQLAKLTGRDRAILFAMRINEEVTNRRYELAIAMGGMDAATLQTVKQNLSDERRHREWISRRLMGRPTRDPVVATGRAAPSKTARKTSAAKPRTARRKPAPKTASKAASK
jgi:bacterioferritin (cytochrome b1)